jgi:hypothetical protein
VSAVGVGLGTAAKTVGIDRGTLRRWRCRRDQGRPLARRRGPRPLPIAALVREQAARRVRELRGLLGVESLRRSIIGLTRRGAARIKRDTLRAMEQERRLAAAHVEVALPGVIRGFDSMDLGRARHLLVSGDGAVPYRTSWVDAPSYDGASVARAFSDDFARNGPPLVLRFDCARQHDEPGVREVLDRNGVLPLHGRPRYPQYYGQLERMNRDQREWLRADPYATSPGGIDLMMNSLNNLWPRRRLGWKTAAEVWNARPVLDVDRRELRKEVVRTSARLVARHAVKPDVAWRVAVKQALARRGLLRVVPGGGC